VHIQWLAIGASAVITTGGVLSIVFWKRIRQSQLDGEDSSGFKKRRPRRYWSPLTGVIPIVIGLVLLIPGFGLAK